MSEADCNELPRYLVARLRRNGEDWSAELDRRADRVRAGTGFELDQQAALDARRG